MHNIKDIRKNLENFKNQIKKRNINIDIDNLKKLDEENRNFIQKKRKIRE